MTQPEIRPRAADAVPSIGRSLLLSPWIALRFQAVELPREFALRTGLSPRLITAVMLVLLLGAGSLAAYGYGVKAQEHRSVTAAREWQEFDLASYTQDAEKMEKVLDRIAYLSPGDPRVAERRAQMKSLEAVPSDQIMIQYCMREHFNHQRRDEFLREAGKRLAAVPGDWAALCMSAHDAVQHGEQARAVELLRKLPPPQSCNPEPNPALLLVALQMTNSLGVPNQVVKEYLILNVLPAVKKVNPATFPFAAKFQYFKLYIESFFLIDRRRELKALWIPFADFSRSLAEDPAVPTAMLNEYGELLGKQLALLFQMDAAGEFPAGEVDGLRAELEGSVNRCWTAMRERDPANPMAYIGPAQVHLIRGETGKAIGMLELGLKACGDDIRLLAFTANFVRQSNPKAAFEIVRQASGRNPDNRAMLYLLAENARAAGELDVARNACARIRAVSPKDLRACREEAAIWQEQNRPSMVLAAFADVMDQVVKDAPSIRLYVLALCHSGNRSEVEAFVAGLAEGATAPALWCEGLAAADEGGMSAFAIAGAQKLTAKWSAYVPGWQVLGSAHAKLAEPATATAGWDQKHATLAIRAYESALLIDPKNAGFANSIVWLFCKGLGQPALADPFVNPLKEAEGRRALPNAYRETLAVWHLGNSRTDEGRRILEELVAADPNAPGYLIHLGQAYLKTGRRDEARDCFVKAGKLPKSNWEIVELQQGLQLLNKGF